MVDYVHGELYQQDSVDKQLVISYEGGTITNEDLYSENFELKESLCSESELRFGSCEASMIMFKMSNTAESLIGKKIRIIEVLDGNEDVPFLFGEYKVFSDVPSGDRNYRNVTSYDAMFDIINADVVEWYDSVFPLKETEKLPEDNIAYEETVRVPGYESITMKEFRDSFFEYFGVMQEEVILPQDDILVEKTIDADSISGQYVITSICELNGVFGHINRNGNFEYVSLAKMTDAGTITPSISYVTYQSCEYEDFLTKTIDKVQIRQEDGDIGAISGSGDNCYIVQDNFLVYGKTPEELTIICDTLYNNIIGISYRPFIAKVPGNPCIEVGDRIIVSSRTKEVESYVLQRTLTGIQSLKDTFEAKGVQEYEEKVNSSQKDIRQLKGKTNVLKRTVEETISRVSDIEKGYSEIRQTSEKVSIEVSKNTEELGKMSYEFSSENMTIEKDGSQMKTVISEDGMQVYKDGNEVLIANNQGVDAKNLHANTYLIIGNNSRLEDYGENRTGVFWIGGN